VGSFKCERPILALDTEDESDEDARTGMLRLGKGTPLSVQLVGECGERAYFRRRGELGIPAGVAQLRADVFAYLATLPPRDLWACNATYDALNLGLVSRGVSAVRAAGGYTAWRHVNLGAHVLFDSHALVPLSVRAMGEAVGLPKLDFAPRDETYAMRDAEIVLAWLLKFRRGLEELCDGATMRATTGATASALFKSMGGEVEPLPVELRHATRSAYRGGRVEVLRFGATGPVEVWDIRSAFPAAMLQGRFPAGSWSPTTEIEPEGIYDVTVRASGPLGPLPVRCEGTNVYPVGRFRGVYWGCELACKGVRVEELHAGWRANEHVEPFRTYVETLWAARNSDEGSPVQTAAKLLLNALYGIIGHAGAIGGITTVNKGSKLEGRIVAPDVLAWTMDKGESRGTNPAWSGLITARVRARLHDEAVAQAGRVVYMDTDSLFLRGHLGAGVGPARQGDGLGDWRIQSTLDDFECVGPKVYAMKFLTGWRYRAKGVPTRVAEEFVRNQVVRWRAPLSIIQAAQLRAGGRDAEAGAWAEVERAIRAQYRARYVAEDGSTEPWDVAQLAAVNAPDPWDDEAAAEDAWVSAGGALAPC
jgi:hypothetical protein